MIAPPHTQAITKHHSQQMWSALTRTKIQKDRLTSRTSSLVVASEILCGKSENSWEHNTFKEHDDNQEEGHIWVGNSDDNDVEYSCEDSKYAHEH